MKEGMRENVLNIEGVLQNDAQGHRKKALITELESEATVLKRRLAAELSPEEHKALTALLASIDSAIEVVETYWLTQNRVAK